MRSLSILSTVLFAGLAAAAAPIGGNALPTGDIFAQIQPIIDAILGLISMLLLIVGLLVLVWAILLLVTLRSIMRRDDLTGGEKTGWVIIAFFFGIVPLSIFGILLYWLSGWKKKKQPIVSQ